MKEILFNEKQIDEIITKLASKINKDYEKCEDIPVLICVLKGAAPFMHDLIKKLNFPMKLDYIQLSSYNGTSSTGVIHLKKDVSENITNKRVIIVEDIIDTGTTLNYLKDYLNIKYKPKEIKLCCLIDKVPARKVKLDADYVGYYLSESKFLVGYGFDYNELFREVPYIFVPDNEDLNKWDELLKKNN